MDNEEQRKVNLLSKQLGVTLITNGEMFLKQGFKVEPKIIKTKNELAAWLSENVFKGQSLWDEKFYVESLDFYLSLIEIWWGDKKQYITDRYDCDNYARHFQSALSLYFGLNSAGTASGSVYDENGKFLARHAFNIILVSDNGVLKPYLFEGMRNIMTQWNGPKTKLGPWLYEIDWIDFN